MTFAITVGATRVPSQTTVGADLLVRAAHSCDMLMAWRVFNSSSFDNSCLVQMGSGGETPLMAATAGGCSELVAWLLLNPGFDERTIKKPKLRLAVAEHAVQSSGVDEVDLSWALIVMDAVMLGKVSVQDLEWDPMLAVTDNAWFLPKAGEWMPPLSLWEMGLPETVEPALNLAGVVIARDERRDLAYCEGEITLRFTDFDKLWRLLVMYLQAPPESWEQVSALNFIRSIGWSLFFWRGRSALFHHTCIMTYVVQNKVELPPENSPVNEHLRSQGRNATEEYRQMGMTLRALWDKIGDWVVINVVPESDTQLEEYTSLVEERDRLARRLAGGPPDEEYTRLVVERDGLARRLAEGPPEGGAGRGRREDEQLAQIVAEGAGVLDNRGDAGRREGVAEGAGAWDRGVTARRHDRDQPPRRVADGAGARDGGVNAGHRGGDQPTGRAAEGAGAPEGGADAGRREEDQLVPEGTEGRADAGRRAGEQIVGRVAEGPGVPEGRVDAGRRDGARRVAEGAGAPEGGLDSSRRAASFRPPPLGIAVRCAWMSLATVAIGSAWC